jgi:DNA-directed RNA polymerase subunit RPC12/RpoP
MTTRFTCEHCGEEFNVEHEPEEVRTATLACPNCGIDTSIQIGSIPPAIPLPAPAIPAPSLITSSPRQESPAMVAVGVLLLVVGLILTLNGCAGNAQNGINQVYCAVQYCSGFILIALSLILIRIS